jgi:hypothetical protein
MTHEMKQPAHDMDYKHIILLFEPRMNHLQNQSFPAFMTYLKSCVNQLVQSLIFLCKMPAANWELISRFACASELVV